MILMKKIWIPLKNRGWRHFANSSLKQAGAQKKDYSLSSHLAGFVKNLQICNSIFYMINRNGCWPSDIM